MKKSIFKLLLLGLPLIISSCSGSSSGGNKKINYYTVTWKSDGVTLEVDEDVKEGTYPIYNGSTPTRESSEQYNYSWTGWDNDISQPVTSDITFNATFSSETREYVITWDIEGNNITESYPYGARPYYKGDTPTKASTEQYDYNFSNWYPDISPVSKDQTYTAEFTSRLRSYEIRWVSEEGQIYYSEYFNYGETPVYRGDTPTKDSDEAFTYTFTNWDHEIDKVTKDETIIAIFEKEYIDYLVSWYNEGTLIYSESYHYGDSLVYKGETPKKAPTAQYTYEFVTFIDNIGRDYNNVLVDNELVLNATYNDILREYDITFVLPTTSVTKTYKYGETPSLGYTPRKESTESTDYTFIGWDPDLRQVEGDATYTAEFEESARVYTVYWYNEGELLYEDSYTYGSTPVYDTALYGTPTTSRYKEGYSYVFNGWSPEIVPITEDTYYYAEYKEVANTYLVTWFINGQATYESYEYNEVASYKGDTPTIEDDPQYEYVFDYWTDYRGQKITDFTVKGNISYYAHFASTTKSYTVKFVNGETVLFENTYLFGDTPVYEGDVPTKPDQGDYTYVFLSWSPEIHTVKGDEIYEATFEEHSKTELEDFTFQENTYNVYIGLKNLTKDVLSIPSYYKGKPVTSLTTSFRSGAFSELHLPNTIKTFGFILPNSLQKLYYKGSEEEYSKISINSYMINQFLPSDNECLLYLNDVLFENATYGSDSSRYGSPFAGCASILRAENIAHADCSYLFANCKNLKYVSFTGGVFNNSGYSALSNCVSLEEIVLDESVTILPRGFARECSNLKTVTGLDHILNFGSELFNNCTNLKFENDTFVFNSNTTSVAYDSFNETTIKAFAISNNERYEVVDGVLYSKDKTKVEAFPALKDGSWTVPETVSRMERIYAYSITSLTIGENVTYIDAWDCNFRNLQTLYFNATNCEVRIGGVSTNYCFIDSLDSLYIGDNVTSLPSNAFYGLNVTYVYTGKNLTAISEYAFYHSTVKYLYLEGRVSSIEASAFERCLKLEHMYYTDPYALKVVKSNAFYNCGKLQFDCTMLHNLVELYPFAFYNCQEAEFTGESLSRVTTFGNYALAHTKTTTSTLSKKLTYIGDGAFYSYDYDGYLDLHDFIDLTYIGESAFYFSNLTSITLPSKSLATVGNHAFGYSRDLTTFTYSGTVSQWKAIKYGSKILEGTKTTYVRCDDGTVDL